MAAKAIEEKLMAEDPTIDRDKAFADADRQARERFATLLPLFEDRMPGMCKDALGMLLASSPVSPYQTHRP